METNLRDPVDGRLKALIATAERDEACPGVCVIVGGWVIQGRPVSTAEFMRTTYRDYVRQFGNTLEGKKILSNPNKEERSKLTRELLQPSMAAFGYKSDADAYALSLGDASVSGSSGPVLKVPVLRIPVSAVQTWWSAGFEVDQGKEYFGGGGGISVGFSI